MPTILARLHRPAAAQALPDGERLVALAVLVMADPGVTGPVSIKEELVCLFNPLMWIGLSGHPGQLLRRLMLGRAVRGGPDSLAAQVHRVCGECGAYRPFVVTATRVLLGELIEIPDRKQNTVGRFEIRHAWPREAFTGARREPKGLLRRGRVVLACADDSTVAIVLQRKCAPVFVEALNPETKTHHGSEK